MSDLAADFFRQNLWANRAMIELCRPLSDQQLDATAPGTYGSIRETMRHIVSAEGGYAFRLGHEPEPRLRRDDSWPDWDALVDMVQATARSFETALHEDPSRTIRVGSEDDPYDVDAGVILTQAFNHSTEHRSQINTILTTLGLEPPELSGWEWALDVDRMRKA